MKIGVMQPYFLPYLGYFQLISAVDSFVVYDNIKYTKQGWINRNRILVNGKDEFITLPLKNDSDYLDINQRRLADRFVLEKRKILNKVRENYRRAVSFPQVYELLEHILDFDDMNLFQFVFNSLKLTCRYLDITTEFVVSSTLPLDHALKAEDRVLSICRCLNAALYINLIGGMDLYSKERFMKHKINLQFLRVNPVVYFQPGEKFIPNLSILDVMMYNYKEEIAVFLQKGYELV